MLLLIGRLLSRDGYNKWRDAKKPTTILAELCRSNGVEPPEYRPSEVKVLNKIFKIPPDAVPEGKGPPAPPVGPFYLKSRFIRGTETRPGGSTTPSERDERGREAGPRNLE